MSSPINEANLAFFDPQTLLHKNEYVAYSPCLRPLPLHIHRSIQLQIGQVRQFLPLQANCIYLWIYLTLFNVNTINLE